MSIFVAGETVQTTIEITIGTIVIPSGTRLVVKETTGAFSEDFIETIYDGQLINIPKTQVSRLSDNV